MRGSKILYVRCPDMLQNAPMFRSFDPKNDDIQALGMGRGMKEILQVQHKSRAENMAAVLQRRFR
eukprot:UN05411